MFFGFSFDAQAMSAMTSAQNNHGGQEQTLMSFYATAIHWGCVIAALGFTDLLFIKRAATLMAIATLKISPLTTTLNPLLAYR